MNPIEHDMKDAPCTRCGEMVLEKHPLAWSVVDLRTPVVDYHTGQQDADRYLLCVECMMALGEWLVPDLKDNAEWVSGKDQVEAQVRDRRK